jgi:hypothetical protein
MASNHLAHRKRKLPAMVSKEDEEFDGSDEYEDCMKEEEEAVWQ